MTAAKVTKIQRMWERVQTEPGLKRNVAVLAVLLVLAGVVGGYIFSHARMNWPWANEFWFNATFQSAPAISPGNGQEVRIAGVKVGEVREASVSDEGKAVLALSIDRKYRVYDNATLVLRPKSPLNEMYIELNPGGPPAKPLPEDGTLPASATTRPVQIDEVLGHLDDNTRTALATLLAESDAALASAPHSLPAGLRASNQVAHKLEPVVKALQTRKENLRKLVSSLSTIAYMSGQNDRRLTELVSSMHGTLATVGGTSRSVDAALAELPELTGRLRSAMDNTQRLADQLDPTLDNLQRASDTLPESLSSFTDTVDQVGRTIDDAQPVVAKAGPVVRDLRPFVTDLNLALPDLKSSTARLDELTEYSVPHLDDLAAFVYNTRSAYSLEDANQGILRGQLTLAPESVTGLKILVDRFPALFAGSGASAPNSMTPKPR